MNKNKLNAYIAQTLKDLRNERDYSVQPYEVGWYYGAISELQALEARITRGEFE